MNRAFLALLPCLLLTGCLTPERQLVPAAVEKIRAGVTTRGAVEKDFGEPRTIEAGHGRTLVIYAYGRPRTTGWLSYDVRLRLLSVLYDAEGVVEKKLLSDRRVPYEQGFFNERSGTPLSRELIAAKVRAGLTRTQAVQYFGSPTYEILTLDGGAVLTWVAHRERGALVNVTEEVQELTLLLDASEVVVDASLLGTLDAPPAKAR